MVDNDIIPHKLGEVAYEHKVQPLFPRDVFEGQNSLCGSSETIPLRNSTMNECGHTSSLALSV